MNEPAYLTTKELADLLRLKERKIYDLVATGAVPHTKATGKLLFPRADVLAWLDSHASGPDAASAGRPLPVVMLGSHDPLLDWALRESRSGIAGWLDGSLDGLQRFGRGEGLATGLHVFDPESQTWNIEAVRTRYSGRPAVLVEWARRQRGLIVAEGSPIARLADLRGKTVVPRQVESGTQDLFGKLLGAAGIGTDDMTLLAPARSETDAAAAVAEGRADAAFGLQSVATSMKLGFVPVIEERFDLLCDRRAWFEPPLQALLAFCRSPAFAEKARASAGYDISGFGTVHFNGA